MSTEMKALTLWQPWASLIAWGHKEYETRSWATAYRGPLAIHAGKMSNAQELFDTNYYYKNALLKHWHKPDDLPKSAVLCIVNLVACVQTDSLRDTILLSQQERNFGDWSHGRWAWRLEMVEVLKEPITVTGAQGLWTWRRE